jgi:hypothetical protein
MFGEGYSGVEWVLYYLSDRHRNLSVLLKMTNFMGRLIA